MCGGLFGAEMLLLTSFLKVPKTMYFRGVPAVRQWVKNLTAAAWVAAEVQVQFPPHCRGLKVLILLQL